MLGKNIRTSKRYWEFIVKFKHAELENKLPEVLKTIQKAQFVYQDTEHREIFLYPAPFGQNYNSIRQKI